MSQTLQYPPHPPSHPPPPENQRSVNKNTTIFYQGITFENVVCKMCAILLRLHVHTGLGNSVTPDMSVTFFFQNICILLFLLKLESPLLTVMVIRTIEKMFANVIPYFDIYCSHIWKRVSKFRLLVTSYNTQHTKKTIPLLTYFEHHFINT